MTFFRRSYVKPGATVTLGWLGLDPSIVLGWSGSNERLTNGRKRNVTFQIVTNVSILTSTAPVNQ